MIRLKYYNNRNWQFDGYVWFDIQQSAQLTNQYASFELEIP